MSGETTWTHREAIESALVLVGIGVFPSECGHDGYECLVHQWPMRARDSLYALIFTNDLDLREGGHRTWDLLCKMLDQEIASGAVPR